MKKTKILFSTLITLTILLLTSLPALSTTYTYDNLGRLTEATYDSGKTVKYTYDAMGNITTVVTAATQSELTVTHRIVRINCPVDAEVYDSKDLLVAGIINEEPQNIEGSSVISLIDANDQKTFRLPATESYAIRITAREDCLMSYAVNEFDENEDTVTRIVYYLDVGLKKGDVLTGNIENMATVPDANYELTGVDGIAIEPTGDLADAEVVDYMVSAEVQGNGTVTGTDTRTKGEFAKLIAIPDEGEEFLGWFLDGVKISSETSYRFCVLSDVSLEARFTELIAPTLYSLTISAGEGGAITYGSSGPYKQGQVIGIAATPGTGYMFAGWTATAGEFTNVKSESTTFIMPDSDAAITAHFELIPEEPEEFTLTILAETGGAITIGASGEYKVGQVISIAAMADSDYMFTGWTATLGSFTNANSAATTFTMPDGDATITANFELIPVEPKTFTLIISAGTGGSITAGSSGQYRQGQVVSIAAAPDTGYMFIGWAATKGSFDNANSAGTTFTMPEGNATITANFALIPEEPETFTLTISAGTGGAITIGTNGEYEQGQIIGIAATPDIGYMFAGWTATRGSFANANSAGTTFNMPASDVIITAHFEPIPEEPDTFVLTISAGTGGTITTGTGGDYKHGQIINIAAAAKSGYIFGGWISTSGAFANAGNAVTTFTMPAANVTITATFIFVGEEKETYTVTFYSNGSMVSSQTVEAGERAIRPSNPIRTGYTFINWYTNPAFTTVYDFDKAVTGNITLYARWQINSGGSGKITSGGNIPTAEPQKPSLINILGNDNQDPTFQDMPNTHWAYQYVEYLARREFVKGKSTALFAPNDPTTRAEFITILARMSDEELPTYEGPFTDVKADAYYAGAVAWGIEEGITKGTSDTTFSPNRSISRQEIATLLGRYLTYKQVTLIEYNQPQSFTDELQIADYAKDFVNAMQKADIINGYPDGSFKPLANATRAEAAKMLAIAHYLMKSG